MRWSCGSERAGASPTVRLVDMSELSPPCVSPGEAYRSAKLAAFMLYKFALGRALAHARTPEAWGAACGVQGKGKA